MMPTKPESLSNTGQQYNAHVFARKAEVRRAWRSVPLLEKMAIAMALHRELHKTFRHGKAPVLDAARSG